MLKVAKQAGFSMIELVVTMAIIALFASIAFPSFQGLIGNNQIRTAAQSFKSGIQLARLEAIKRNGNVKFTLNSDFSWEVGCTTATTDCPAKITEKPPKEGTSSVLTVTSSDSSGSVITPPATIEFTTLGIPSSAANQLARIDVTHSTLGTSAKALRVNLSGASVKMCDPAITLSSDSRKC